MAIDHSRLGDKIVDRLKADGFYPSTSGAHEARSRAEWKAIADEILKELTGHMDIELDAADIHVDPGTFQDSLHAPVTGVGISEAVTLAGKLK